MADELATRRELEQLRTDVIRLDDHGTRGTAVLGSQLGDMIRDMAELKGEVAARFAEHGRLHEREQSERIANRRWGLAFAVAVLAAVGGLYPYLHAISHH